MQKERLFPIILLCLSASAFAISSYEFKLFEPAYFWVAIGIILFILGLYRSSGVDLKEKYFAFSKRKTDEKASINEINTRRIILGVLIVLTIGLITIGMYAYDSCFKTGMVLFTILTITGGAAFLIGSFIGFLFGIPRYNSQPVVANVVAGGPDGIDNNAENGAVRSTVNLSTGSEAGFLYGANTNLEQVSDWLTKILLGAGLTQINEIPGFVSNLSRRVFTAVDCPQSGSPFVSMVIIYFMIGGFFFGYLVTVLNLGYLLEISAGLKKEMDKKDQQLQTITKNLVNQDDIGGGIKVPEIIQYSNNSTVAFANDPQKGQWGGHPENNGFKLSAHVKQLTQDIGPVHAIFSLKLMVEATERKEGFEGSVVLFHLHPTFNPTVMSAIVRGGLAEINIKAWGAFTVGAQTSDGTKLELDLSELSDAPRLFRAR